MPRKNSYITITDQFCGAGGSSQGARRVAERKGGIEIKLAMNHWKLAIETHNTNFPDTDHDCTDISASDPRRYISTDILITSPECTNHSLANGKKKHKQQMDLFDKGVSDAAADRSRATMWDVCRFAEYHNYRVIIVENVVDARKWIMFDAWLNAMNVLGYNHKCVYMNSMHQHPTPQSRDRMYVVFWKKGNKAPDLEFKPKAYCPKCETDIAAIQSWKDRRKPFGKYRQQYVYGCPSCASIVEPYYHAAFNCIDWSDIGTKISERSKDLSVNTIRRIKFGLEKYGNNPIQMIDPLIIKLEHSRQDNVRSSYQPFATQTTRQSLALLTPHIIEMNKTGKMRIATAPTSTFTAEGINHSFCMVPFITISRGKSKTINSFDPLNTVSTGGIHSGIVSTEAWKSFIHYNYGSDTLSDINKPLGSCTTKDRHAVITYQKPILEECYYRMLKPHEVKLAMAFDNDYIVLGSGRDQVKQLGNAVTPPAMEWLVERAIDSLS